jgi:hypothetical protein
MRRLKIAAGVLGVLAMLAAIAWIVVLPWWVRKHIVEEAAARGVQLQLGSVSIHWSSATVSGVTATADQVPGVTMTAGRVDVQLDRFEPTAVTVVNASVGVEGKVGDVAKAVEKFLAAQRTGTGAATTAPPISMQNARIDWRQAVGDGTILHVGDFGGDIGGTPFATDVKVHFAGITVDSFGTPSVGPWSGTLTRTKEQSEVTLVLSPKGPDVAQVRISHPIGSDGQRIDVAITQPLSFVELGFSKSFAGLFGLEDGTLLVDGTHVEEKGSGHGNIRKARLQGFRLSRAQAAATLELVDIAYVGPLEKMTITQGRVNVGPLSGPLDGIIGRANGLTIQAHTKTDVMKCTDAIKAQAGDVIGGQAVGILDNVAGVLGLDRQVSGTVTADARWSFDSRDPMAASLKITPTATCDLSFLPK